MGNKFFKEKVYSRRRNTINYIIIGCCVVGVVIFFMFTSTLNSESEISYDVEVLDSVSLTVNSSEPNKTIFFKQVIGIEIDSITMDYSLVDFNKVGSYIVKAHVYKEELELTLNIIDVTSPVVTLNDVSIDFGDSYKPEDFIKECTDNSNEDCNYEFYTGSVDPYGNQIDYSSFTEEGTYEIKIRTYDNYENDIVKTASLKIGDLGDLTICDFGNLEYDDEQFILADMIGTNGCAIDLNLYQDETVRANVTSIADTESKRLKAEIDLIENLEGNLIINRSIGAILNSSGYGVIGYSLYVEALDGNGNVIVSYNLDLDGKRVFIENPYKLEN